MTTHAIIRGITAGAIAAALTFSASPAEAQRTARYSGAARVHAVSQADIEQAIQRGYEHAQHARFAAARREFRAAAAMQTRNAALPEEALWQVAAAHFAENDARSAARTLDELAELAASFGQPDVQAKALLEAAFLHRRSGDIARSEHIARELRLLARSPFIDAELRQSIERRLGA